MSGRPAPPGRKGSVRINAFKADDETATPVSVATMTAAERQKHERDEEMKKLMALRKQAQAEESGTPEVKKVETPSKQVDTSAEDQKKKERAEADKKRLEEVRARNAKLEEDERAVDAARIAAADAEKAAAAKKAADDAEKVRAAAAAKRAAEDAERAAVAKKAAEDAERAAAAKKAADEAELARAAAKKAAEDAEKAAAAKKAAEDAERAAAAKKAADEAEQARAAAKKAAEDAEKVAAAKKAAEDAERVAAAKKAADEAEQARAAVKQAAEEKAREEELKAAEAAHAAAVAAKEERRLQKEAEKAAKAEQARAQLEEQQRREQEEADAEEAAYQAEQDRQKLQLEAQRKKREEDEAKRQLEQQEFLRQQELLEEQQRRMDEKAAAQRAALAEAAANEKREQEALLQKQQAEAEERKRVKQEELAARQAAEQAEIARLREEEAVRQQALIDAQRREEEEHNAEAARLEQDRIAAAEEARKAEEAISQYENAALEEKKRRAEAQRKKREAFLNDMDTFSTNFEAKTQVEDESIKAEQDKHYELLAQQMKQVEEAKAATLAKEAQEKEQRAAQLAAAAEIAAAELAAANVPPPAPVVVRSSAPKEDSYSINLNGSEEPKRDLLGDLTTSLFTSSSMAAAAPISTPAPTPAPVLAPVAATAVVEKVEEPAPATEERASPAAMESIEEEGDGEEEAEPAAAGGTEELRVPTRIGSGKAVKGSKVQHKPVSVSVINARTAAATVKYSEDEEEEGTGEAGSISNVLTLEERRKLTLAQKETWRAKQADLTDKRKDFHGVVTYTFDGVFSWQMYGSAEAVDESGSNYTEYLMRCQWGTTFDNMQPWIVAHRYKEFDLLDQQLKRKFPRLEPNMPKLPKKDLFRSLHADVVAQRRAVLEEYMSKIVNSMPSLVRSELMNDFLDITNRISGIRLMLLKMSNAKVEALHTPPPTPTPSRPVSTTPISKGPVTGVSSNSKYGIEDPLAFRSVANEQEAFANEVEEEPLYWTLDDAEEARAAKNSRSLDEDQLGRLEIDVRALGVLIRKENGKALVAKDSKFRTVYKTVSARWPNLRATAVVGMGVDFTLIPRAMQTEEDLLRYVNEFRNIETLSGMSRAGVSV